jgi:S-(hydroxymethyl)glutathione dehydrogenase/alcohol dehydrogenase
MKAAVLYEVNTPLVVEDGVESLDPGPREVQVRVAASGVCHSDLHFMDGSWTANLPLVLGHEAAGTVEQIGSDVASVAVGDKVVLLFVPYCGVCEFCQQGKPNLCLQGTRVPGITRGPKLRKGDVGLRQFMNVGSFAEHIVVPESSVVKVPDDAPLDKVCLVGCAVTTGIGAVVNTAKVPAGASIAVVGCGGVGLNVIQGAALVGANPIIAVDLLPAKLDLAKTFGATHTVNAAEVDAAAAVHDLTGGGVNYAFEAIGNPKAVEQAFSMTRRAGTCVVVGMPPVGSSIEISPVDLFLGERQVLGCYYGSVRPRIDIPRLIGLYMQGKVKLDELVSRTFALEEVNEAFDAMKRGEVARGVIVYE